MSRRSNGLSPNRQNHPDRVPVDLFRERYLKLVGEGRFSAAEVARAAGYVLDGRADTRRLRRKLGIDHHVSHKTVKGVRTRYLYRQRTIAYDDAVGLLEPLDLDPVDVDV